MGLRGRTSQLQGFRWYRRSDLWVVPTTGVAVALVVATASLGADQLLVTDEAPFPIFQGEADTARELLSLIGSSIATLTALVLTIVAVVIQLATQNLSPRAVRTFLQDAHSHLTLGTFVTTFTYALVILQQFARIDDNDDVVRSSSVTVAFVLAVVSIGMFISYVHHIVHQARVSSVIDRIGRETLQAIERDYPEPGQEHDPVVADLPDRDPDLVVRSSEHGVILEIDLDGLVEALERADAVAILVPAVGDFVPTGGRLLNVHSDGDLDADRLRETVELDAERSIMHDIPSGFRLLVDIAERALSPGVNDPTTATQVLDQIYDLLRQLGLRSFPTGWRRDNDGRPRAFVPRPSLQLPLTANSQHAILAYTIAGLTRKGTQKIARTDSITAPLPTQPRAMSRARGSGIKECCCASNLRAGMNPCELGLMSGCRWHVWCSY